MVMTVEFTFPCLCIGLVSLKKCQALTRQMWTIMEEKASLRVLKKIVWSSSKYRICYLHLLHILLLNTLIQITYHGMFYSFVLPIVFSSCIDELIIDSLSIYFSFLGNHYVHILSSPRCDLGLPTTYIFSFLEIPPDATPYIPRTRYQ